jgi:hypothetical protein
MADGRWSYRFSPLLSHQVTCRRNSSSTRWATRPCTMSASSNPASPIPEVVRCVPCALPLLGRRARRRTPSTATPSSAANRPAPHQPLRAVESLRPPSSHAAACASLRAVTTAEAFSISSAESVATQLSAPGDGTWPTQRRNLRRFIPALVVPQCLHDRIPRYNELIGCDGREVGDACDRPHTLPTATAAGRPARTTPTRSQTWSNMSRSHAGPSALSVARYVFRERYGCRATRR